MIKDGIPHTTADFICFVCGAIFTTDEDRKQHLEKEGHGKLHDTTTEEEKKNAIDQEKINEERTHHVQAIVVDVITTDLLDVKTSQNAQTFGTKLEIISQDQEKANSILRSTVKKGKIAV